MAKTIQRSCTLLDSDMRALVIVLSALESYRHEYLTTYGPDAELDAAIDALGTKLDDAGEGL